MKPLGQRVFGKSHAGLDISTNRYGTGQLSVLLIGGVHGDESEGYIFAERFESELQKDKIKLPDEVVLHVCARLNPDGCKANRRTNHRNVDLNRNMPTKDWTGEFTNVRYYPGPHAGSESENQALLAMIQETRPSVILSLHSYENPMVNFNGESEDLGKAMSEKNGLPAKGDIGYPTPGSLGTYAGWERNIPTITLEILRGQDPDTVWSTHLGGVELAIGYYLHHKLPRRKG
ncbi:MAG: DUF2817 domain-containing protein [Leptospirales bacterium]|nr:DUF2817 domain-containing protein [Leptospirales bacterium]